MLRFMQLSSRPEGNTVMKRKGNALQRDDGSTRVQKPSDWDERLRLVGDARFVDVEWSTRDQPAWPLPTLR